MRNDKLTRETIKFLTLKWLIENNNNKNKNNNSVPEGDSGYHLTPPY